ncbi:MAG: hypothetical protein ACPGUV_02120 [Polyangiales bacterium]
MIPCLGPAVARAGVDHGAPESGGSGESLAIVVIFIACLVAAYLIAHFVVDRLQQRFLVHVGLEYIFVGVAIGPLVPQIPVLSDLRGILPMIALAAGWIGLLRGMELNLRQLGRAPGSAQVSLVHAVVAGGLCTAGAYHAFLAPGWPRPASPAAQVALCAGVLGCVAAAGGTAPLQVLARRYTLEGPLVPLLARAARLSDLFAIAVFGVLFCVFRPEGSQAGLILSATEWAVVSVGLGLGLGLLFTPFLGGEESANSRFLALVGLICFASGTAYLLRLPALLVNLVLGVTLVNTAKSGAKIQATLENTARPMHLVLLVLAGALWQPPPALATLLATAGFVLLRTLGKFLASRVAAWGTALRPDLYRGLLGHGEVTVAMAVSFRLVYAGPLVDLTYTVILASVVLQDLLAPRLLRALLVDAGQLERGSQVREEALASGASRVE